MSPSSASIPDGTSLAIKYRVCLDHFRADPVLEIISGPLVLAPIFSNGMGNVIAAIMWPHRRLQKIQDSLAAPDQYEEMDGLSALADEDIGTVVLDPMPYPLNPFLRRGSLLSGMDLLRTLRLLRVYRKVDVVVSIGESSCFWFVLLKRLLALRKPVVIIDPALGPEYPARQRLQRWVLPYVERVIVYSRVQEEYLKAEYGDGVPSSFLHHRISTQFFDPSRSTNRLPAHAAQVISVGGDISRDFETLCRALDGVAVNAAVYTRKPIGVSVPENLQIHREWIPYHDLRERYLQARIVVVPLHRAIHPSGINALLEAMAMGKAVIVSDSAGIRDYVTHGRTAWVVPPEDPIALRNAILHLLSDSETQRELGQNARQFCETHCSFPVYGKKVGTILKELAVSSRNRGMVRLGVENQ